MSGELPCALGLVSSSLGAAVAGVPWLAVAAVLAAIPYLVIGAFRLADVLRGREGGIPGPSV